MDRSGLTALLDYARRGDTLAVVRLDRLGRSLAELLATVAMLKERSIALVSLEERIDTSSAAGELIFHVFGAIAHFERRLIAEHTKDGIAAARARGKRPGRHPVDPNKIAAALRLARDWSVFLDEHSVPLMPVSWRRPHHAWSCRPRRSRSSAERGAPGR